MTPSAKCGTTGAWIGGTSDRRSTLNYQQTRASLSVNGGAQVPAAGGSITLSCRWQGGGGYGDGHIVILNVGGYS